jgi:hypothetical protein
VVIYPASLLVLKIYFSINFGNSFAGYLFNFPALFVLEWVIPAFYVICAVMLRRWQREEDAKSRRTPPIEEQPLRESKGFY